MNECRLSERPVHDQNHAPALKPACGRLLLHSLLTANVAWMPRNMCTYAPRVCTRVWTLDFGGRSLAWLSGRGIRRRAEDTPKSPPTQITAHPTPHLLLPNSRCAQTPGACFSLEDCSTKAAVYARRARGTPDKNVAIKCDTVSSHIPHVASATAARLRG
jgi:hypothetical protein